MSLLISAILVLVFILAGMNIGVSFLTSSIFYQMIADGSISSFARSAFGSINSYSLLAVPLFMLGGQLMERSGIANSLVDFCEALLRKVKGGLGAVIPVVSMAFGTLCGSALATVSTIGLIMIKRMEKLGWDRRYTAALVAASSPLGYMIPPNMNAIIFSMVSTASVSALFLAAVIPGIIWGLGYVAMNRVVYKKWLNNPQAPALQEADGALPDGGPDGQAWTKGEQKAIAMQQPISIGRATVRAIPAFIMPIIILGGIYGGLCTPTEAGAVSALYALIAGIFIYRQLKAKDVWSVFSETARSLGPMFLIFPFATLFSKIMVLEGLPQAMMRTVGGLNLPNFVMLLIIVMIFLVAGCFFDAPILTLVLPPLMAPTMHMLGVGDVQFGVIVFMAIGIGSFTPPMASNLFVAAKLGRVNMREMLKPLMPFLFGVAIPVMLLVTFIPALSTWLPNLVLGR